mmetsp:Transcript_21117/g.45787  ORF Transcript_21117/g.45787 Transcript_21117/m.45787 type:complete len:220 (-) Transcript_21117:293-952(-)
MCEQPHHDIVGCQCDTCSRHSEEQRVGKSSIQTFDSGVSEYLSKAIPSASIDTSLPISHQTIPECIRRVDCQRCGRPRPEAASDALRQRGVFAAGPVDAQPMLRALEAHHKDTTSKSLYDEVRSQSLEESHEAHTLHGSGDGERNCRFDGLLLDLDVCDGAGQQRHQATTRHRGEENAGEVRPSTETTFCEPFWVTRHQPALESPIETEVQTTDERDRH